MRYVTHEQLEEVLEDLNERIDRMEASQQGQVNALVTAIDQVATDTAAAQVKLQSEIDALATVNPSLDLTGLQAAVAPLDAAVQALGAITPTPPAPPTPVA